MKTRVLKVLFSIVALIGFLTCNQNTFAQTVTFADANTTANGITADPLRYGQTDIVLYGFTVTVNSASANINTFNLTCSSTANNFFSNFRLYKATSGTTFPGIGATPVASGFSASTTMSITGLNQAFTAGQSNTYFIVADFTGTGTIPATKQFGLSTTSAGAAVQTTPTNKKFTTGSALLGTNFNLAIPLYTTTDANTAANGITQGTITAGQDVVMFGFGITAPETTTISGFKITTTYDAANSPSKYFTNGKIYSSTSSVFSLSTATPLNSASVVFGTAASGGIGITVTNLNEVYTYSATPTPVYYFIVGNYSVINAVAENMQFSLLSATSGGVSQSSPTNKTTYTVSTDITGATLPLAPSKPNVTITGLNTAANGITPTPIAYAQTVVLYGFQLTATNNSSTVTGINFSDPGGEPILQFFSNFKLVSCPTSTYSAATATPVTATFPSSPSSAFNLTSMSEALTANQSKYYFILGDWTSTQANILPYTEYLNYSSLTTATSSTITDGGGTTGQNFPLTSPVITLTNSTTGVYTGTAILSNTSYNLIGFTLSYSAPTNVHTIRLKISYPSGGDDITNYVSTSNGVQMYDAATNTVVPSVSLSVNAGYIDINFALAVQSGTHSYYLKFTFGNFSSLNHMPTALSLCMDPSTVSAAGLCGNNSGCSLVNNYITPATGSSCGQTYIGATVYDWIGTTSSAWNVTSNWLKDSAAATTTPGNKSTDYVRIGVNSYSANTQPVLGSSPVTIGELELGKLGSTSSSAANVTLDMSGKNITVNNGLTIDAGANVFLNNSSASTTSTLSVSGTSNIASTAVLNFTSGTNNVILKNNSGTLTLTSDANGTANIAAVPSGSGITGNVIAQRYIPGGSVLTTRKYRLLSSPVNQYTGNQYDFQNLKLNSLVTGANPTVNGFDVSALNNASIYLYKEALSSYPPVTAITQKVNVGTGFYFYFRGDRTDPASNGDKYVKPYKDPENTTETWIGAINSGTITVPVTYTARYSAPTVYNTGNGFNLVGNPYPSAIDLNSLTLSPECSSIIYEYNYRTGNFDTYDIAHNLPSTGDMSLRYIASGQGFFIKMNDPAVKPAAGTISNGSVTFTENAKSTANNTGTHLLMGTKTNNNVLPLIRVKLEMDSANADNAVICFKDGYADAYDNNDAIRFGSIESKVSLASLSSDRKGLSMNFMPDVSTVKHVNLSVSSTTTGLYTFRFASTETIDSRYAIWLKDNYKKDSLDLRNNSAYAFNIDRADTSSFGDNRFEIVFHEDIPAYTLRSFSVEKAGSGAKLTWVTSNEADYTGFTLEKQDSNSQFQPIYSVQSDGRGTYDFTDTQLNNGDNYYRLKQNDADSKISYSKTVDLVNNSSSTVKNNLIVYPTPATTVIHTSSSTINEACKMLIFNTSGKKLLDKNVDNGGNASQYIGNYLPGTYIIQLVGLKDNKVLGVTKFSKN